jgi:GNAT superfamily N-acetyltransferase
MEGSMAYRDFLQARALPGSITESLLESRRFGLTVGRLTLGQGDPVRPREVKELILASGLDLTILRYPSEHVRLAAGLLDDRLTGWHADTLLYFERVWDSTSEPPAIVRDVRLAHLRPEQAVLLATAVRDVFAAYGNHYAANPWLDQDAALDGYVEWAVGALGSPANSALMLQSVPDGTPLAVCTVDLESDIAEIELAGVVAAARGQGIYRRLLDHVECWLQAAGKSGVVISTQPGTRTAIRAWNERGYRYALGVNTMHLMPSESFHRLASRD